MKDTTKNSSSQDSIHSKNPLKRLYVFTGKGGVGKTSLALAFCKHLLSQKKTVLYNNVDQIMNLDLCDKLQVPYLPIKIPDTIKKYIAAKLNSEVIASWIMQTSFAQSIFNIVPGIDYMMFLGYIVYLLEENPELIIVLDSQSSGHAISMFESPFNFQKIFGAGILFNDIVKIQEFLCNPDNMKIYVINLPTPMSMAEGIELQEYLHHLSIPNIELIINNSISAIPEIDSIANIPDFLRKKIELEHLIHSQRDCSHTAKIPHIISNSTQIIIKKLQPYIGEHV